MAFGNNLKEEILRLLTKSQSGMSILSISDTLRTSRYTVSRYVFAMQEAGYIECHEVGRAKICFLKRGKR